MASNNLSGMASQGQETPVVPNMVLLDLFFPGFSTFANAIHNAFGINLNLYIPLVILLGMLTVSWNYFSEYLWASLNNYFMATMDIRTDDEIYNILMAWVSSQQFSKRARRFVVNTNLNSRSWSLWRWDDDEDETSMGEEEKNKKALSYTPSFGSHYFWYRGRLLLFRRTSKESNGFLTVSEKEEISISCFGRDPYILKELLQEARQKYIERDQKKTLIYRASGHATSDPTWTRIMARASRPFSTVILDKKTKQDLIDDVTDYIDPATQRWYSNRGIPYRRGYLLHGPPGTGKSSLSLALAGYFQMRIYIVSLSSIVATEENLASLFAELPRRCVVLLEDIDTAGLTHTREENDQPGAAKSGSETEPGPATPGIVVANSTGRLSLSGLLNILDGVASQEGRVLIMTTNHLEKLDKALIRPGRVDMIVQFGRADAEMTAAIFRAIFAPLEADEPKKLVVEDPLLDPKVQKEQSEEKSRKREADQALVETLAIKYSAAIPAHEFSPAEIQGHLLRHKRSPQAAVDGADEFIEQTRKDRKDKEIKEAEERRKAEEKKKEEEAEKKKEEEEKRKKEEAEKKEQEENERREKKKKQKKQNKKASKSSEASDSASSFSEGSNDEEDEDKKKKRKTTKSKAVKVDQVPSANSTSGSDRSGDESSELGRQAGLKVDKGEALMEVPKSVGKGHERKDSGYVTPTAVDA